MWKQRICDASCMKGGMLHRKVRARGKSVAHGKEGSSGCVWECVEGVEPWVGSLRRHVRDAKSPCRLVRSRKDN